MNDSEPKDLLNNSNAVENLSYSLSAAMSSLLKIVEYLSLAAFVGFCFLRFVLSDNPVILIWGAVSLSLFVFILLAERQLSESSRKVAYQLELGKRARLYSYSLEPDNSSEDSPLTLAREKALRYCQDLIDDYKNTRNNSRNIYYTFQMATVVLSGVTPILVLVDKLEAGQSWLKWLPVICPAIASIVASIVTSFPFQENWISANTIVELLEAEQEKFILGVSPAYRCYDVADEAQHQQKTQEAIENFIVQVNNIHLKQVQESGQNKGREEQTEQAKPEEVKL